MRKLLYTVALFVMASACSTKPEQPNGSCNFVAFTDKATMTFTTNRPMKMVYTLDGTEPTPESTVYTAPFDIQREIGRAHV